MGFQVKVAYFIYLLTQLLGEEAQMVTVEEQLAREGTLSRYQHSTNRIQCRVCTAWEDYMKNLVD